MKRLIIILLALLVFAGGAIGAVRWKQGRKADASPKSKPAKHYAVEAGEYITNLADEGRYIKTKVELAVGSAADQKELKSKEGLIRHTILAVLRAQVSSDLLGAEGMERLGELLRERLNQVLGEGKVLDVFFLDFVIQ